MNTTPNAFAAPSGETPDSHAPLRAASRIRRVWFPVLIGLAGVYAVLPWLAPVFMHAGWPGAARAIYLAYSTQCHQLAQRSYFLFGPRLMYSPTELGLAASPDSFLALRAFIGSPDLGWKVAWSDRMVAMYSSLFVFIGVMFALRRHVSPLPVAGFILLLLPLALDGTTHFISDFAGLGNGFRDTNAWLAALTGVRFSARFLAGDQWGSLNSWLRLTTGVLFGLGVAWFAVPRLALEFGNDTRSVPGPAYRPAPDESTLNPRWEVNHGH